MDRRTRPLTDRELRAWLADGQTARGIGEGLTFVAGAGAALNGKASWVLRYRLHGRLREKVLGRYPEVSLKDAREQARKDRIKIEQGVDVAAEKQFEKARLTEAPTVQRLGEIWLDRYIEPRYEHPHKVAAVFRKHIYPTLGSLTPRDVRPMHIDRTLQCIVNAGAPTVANEALRHMSRMFKMAVRNHWIEIKPPAKIRLCSNGWPSIRDSTCTSRRPRPRG